MMMENTGSETVTSCLPENNFSAKIRIHLLEFYLDLLTALSNSAINSSASFLDLITVAKLS
jgi:hypothetical protein